MACGPSSLPLETLSTPDPNARLLPREDATRHYHPRQTDVRLDSAGRDAVEVIPFRTGGRVAKDYFFGDTANIRKHHATSDLGQAYRLERPYTYTSKRPLGLRFGADTGARVMISPVGGAWRPSESSAPVVPRAPGAPTIVQHVKFDGPSERKLTFGTGFASRYTDAWVGSRAIR